MHAVQSWLLATEVSDDSSGFSSQRVRKFDGDQLLITSWRGERAA